MLDPVEVTMKEDSDDCIPQRKVFSALGTGVHPIPLLREFLVPGVCLTVAFNLTEVRNFSLEIIIDEVNAHPQE